MKRTNTMKIKKLAIITALLVAPFAYAADDHSKETEEEHHEHEENVNQGPNGGHVVKTKADFAFEVTVDKERKARIVFLDHDLKAIALSGQAITGIAGERSAPVKLTFVKGKDGDANVLISDKALPAGEHIPMILTIKVAPDAKSVVERFELHLH